MATQIEIERKYVIYMPSFSDIEKMQDYSRDEILQTYLNSSPLETRRVRMRKSAGGIKYYETVKRRIDKISSVETEREISETEYSQLLLDSRSDSMPIIKTRCAFTYCEQVFEIDIYPNWKKSAIMETELESREKSVDFPPFIQIIAEVSGDVRYSNAAMAKSFPEELI